MLTSQDIRATLARFVEEETGEGPPALKPSTPLREGLGLDSVDLVSMVMRIEQHYHVRLSYADLEQVVTVEDMTRLIAVKVSAGGVAAAA